MSNDTGVFTVYGNITVAFCNPLPFYFLSWQRLAAGVAAVVLCSIAALLRQAALAGVIFGSHLVLILSWFSYGLFMLPLPSTPSPASTFTPPLLFLTSSSPSLFCTFSPSPRVSSFNTTTSLPLHVSVSSLKYLQPCCRPVASLIYSFIRFYTCCCPYTLQIYKKTLSVMLLTPLFAV